MICSRIFFGLLLLLPTSALAEPPDNAALAKAFQKLSQRVDRLQKEVDALKGAGPTGSSASLVPASPPKNAAAPDASIPGWVVGVIPAEDTSKDAVASFSYDKPEFDFGLHTKYVTGHNPYTYRGVARFYPDEKARYVFQLTLDPVRHNSGNAYTCAGNVKINDEIIVEGKADAQNASGEFDTKGEMLSPKTFSGGTELDAQTDPKTGYKISFEVSCYLREQDHTAMPDYMFPHWQNNRFAITVKGPDDASGRPFEASELYHSGRPKKTRSAQ